MPTLQVRDVPEHIYRTLTEQAKLERRSLAQQVVVTLERGLNAEIDPRQRRQAALAEARKRGRVPGFIDPTRWIREDRQR